MSEPEMWIGLHTGPPKVEYDDYGLRQRATDAFARVDVDRGGRGTWSAPAVEPTPVRVVLADGSWADHTFAGGSPGSVTHFRVFDAPTGGSMRDLQPTDETVVDGEGVTRQVWREVADPEDEQ